MDQLPASLAGHILLAHPLLRDPNFCKSIVFLTAHEESTGAFGFILNRPLDGGDDSLGNAPVYFGGPVETEKFSFVRFAWNSSPPSVSCRIFDENAPDIEAPTGEAILFQGYAGWSPGQLEEEIAQGTWVVILPSQHILALPGPEDLWRDLIRAISPRLELLCEFPPDPSKN